MRIIIMAVLVIWLGLNQAMAASVCPKAAMKHGGAKVCAAIMAAHKNHGIPAAVIAAVVENESSYRVRARGSHGEIGLMQLKPETAKWVALKNKLKWRGTKSLYDPKVNVDLGTRYLKSLLKRFNGDGQKALIAYNMGTKGMLRAGDKAPTTYSSRVFSRWMHLQTQEAPLMAMAEIP